MKDMPAPLERALLRETLLLRSLEIPFFSLAALDSDFECRVFNFFKEIICAKLISFLKLIQHLKNRLEYQSRRCLFIVFLGGFNSYFSSFSLVFFPLIPSQALFSFFRLIIASSPSLTEERSKQTQNRNYALQCTFIIENCIKGVYSQE